MMFASVFQTCRERHANTRAHGAVTVLGENRVDGELWSYAVRLADGRTASVPRHLLREDISIPPVPADARRVA